MMRPLINLAKNCGLLLGIDLSRKYSNISFRLEKVGKLDSLKKDGHYDTGQLILHRLFGYRGIILAHWQAKLFDKDIKTTDVGVDDASRSKSKKVEGKPVVYYHVLVDNRDLPYSNVLKDGVTFLPEGNKVSNTILIIPGMDYATHDDLLPFTSTDSHPVDNDYFREFLMYDPDKDPPYVPRDSLLNWLEEKHQWLEMSSVHRETTSGIRITAIPFYMGARQISEMDNDENNYIRYWRYLIRIENLTNQTVQLRERFWKVFSVSGSLESVKGKGVVGVQPILESSNPVFQYHSHVQLQAPWGHMWGSFKFERSDGTFFDAKIPAFPLSSRHEEWDSASLGN